MSLASSIALLVLLVTSAVGWWSGQRLAASANLGQVRRRARWIFVAGVVAIAAGAVHVGSDIVGDGAVWIDLALAAIIGLPLLAVLTITVPRSLAIARRHRASDPLHWPGRLQRAELAAPALVVPFAAALLGSLAVLLLPNPSVGGAGLQHMFAALAVVAATLLIGRRRRRLRNRVVVPASYADLRWTPGIERAGVR